MYKNDKQYKATVLGGGTGSFTILSALKRYPDVSLDAIVAMTDDGGSTGVLRDELGVLPAGDARQCLVALSQSPNDWREVFTYRFAEGNGLAGHTLGNLIIAGLEQQTGSYEEALERAGRLLQTRGRVLPVTLDNVRLVAQTPDGRTIRGEHQIDLKEHPIQSLSFDPVPSANPRALESILNSQLVILCPGDLYTSILPTILVPGIKEALCDTRAPVIYVCNLMTQRNHTQGFQVTDFVDLLHRHVGQPFVNIVLYNIEKPHRILLERYAGEGEELVAFSKQDFAGRSEYYFGYDFLSPAIHASQPGDHVTRSLIRHHQDRIAHALYRLVKNHRSYRK